MTLTFTERVEKVRVEIRGAFRKANLVGTRIQKQRECQKYQTIKISGKVVGGQQAVIERELEAVVDRMKSIGYLCTWRFSDFDMAYLFNVNKRKDIDL